MLLSIFPTFDVYVPKIFHHCFLIILLSVRFSVPWNVIRVQDIVDGILAMCGSGILSSLMQNASSCKVLGEVLRTSR